MLIIHVTSNQIQVRYIYLLGLTIMKYETMNIKKLKGGVGGGGEEE